MRIESVVVRRLVMPMKERFVTSFGSEDDKEVLVVEVRTDEGAVGFAECVAMSEPLYNEETIDTSLSMLERFFVPEIFKMTLEKESELHHVRRSLGHFKGNRMAKASLEMAVWDAWANQNRRPLADLLGGSRDEVSVGISVGIQPDVAALLQKIDGYLNQGFQRIKVKVKPGWDIDVIRDIRRAFGDIPLMADANSAYRLNQLEHLRRFDDFGLMMIEQPLSSDDIVDHAELQRAISTPVCLDESIHSAQDAEKAIRLGACNIINVKVGRVGGFSEALAIHEVCQQHNIPMWCGGMLETGIGRLHNIALTALPGFTLPGDTAPSARYFEEDLIEPPVVFTRPGVLAVDPLCGVAERVQLERLEKWTVQERKFDRA